MPPFMTTSQWRFSPLNWSWAYVGVVPRAWETMDAFPTTKVVGGDADARWPNGPSAGGGAAGRDAELGAVALVDAGAGRRVAVAAGERVDLAGRLAEAPHHDEVVTGRVGAAGVDVVFHPEPESGRPSQHGIAADDVRVVNQVHSEKRARSVVVVAV